MTDDAKILSREEFKRELSVMENHAAEWGRILDHDAALRAQLSAWQDRFRAIVDQDSPDAAGNEVLSLQRQLAEVRTELEKSVLVGRNLTKERDALAAENARLKEALFPSGETKAAYLGEFSFDVYDSDAEGEEFSCSVMVPRTTIKEIMAAILQRAAKGST